MDRIKGRLDRLKSLSFSDGSSYGELFAEAPQLRRLESNQGFASEFPWAQLIYFKSSFNTFSEFTRILPQLVNIVECHIIGWDEEEDDTVTHDTITLLALQKLYLDGMPLPPSLIMPRLTHIRAGLQYLDILPHVVSRSGCDLQSVALRASLESTTLVSLSALRYCPTIRDLEISNAGDINALCAALTVRHDALIWLPELNDIKFILNAEVQGLAPGPASGFAHLNLEALVVMLKSRWNIEGCARICHVHIDASWLVELQYIEALLTRLVEFDDGELSLWLTDEPSWDVGAPTVPVPASLRFSETYIEKKAYEFHDFTGTSVHCRNFLGRPTAPTTLTRRTQATTWGASPRFLLLPAPTSTSTSPLALAHTRTNSSSLTTAPYSRGHRPSSSSSTLFSLTRKKSSASLRSPYDGTPGGSSISLASISHPLPHPLLKTEFSALPRGGLTPEQLKAISGTREGGVGRFGVPFGEAAVRYAAASANASRVDLGEDLPPGWEDVAGSSGVGEGSGEQRILDPAQIPVSPSPTAEHRAGDALATPDPHDALSTPASHGALASPDPRDALSTPDSRRSDVQSHFPRLTVRIHAGESPLLTFFLSLRLVSRPTPLAPSESAPCPHMLRSAAADRERRLAAEAYALAESQYASISRAPAREPRMCSVPPKKKRNHCTHRTEKSARQHVKARKGVLESVTRGKSATATFFDADSALARTSARPRSGGTPPRVGLEHPRRSAAALARNASRTRLESRAQSLRTPRTFDSLHASPARGAASLWLARWHAAHGVFGLARSKPRARRLQLFAVSSLCTRVAPRRAVPTRAH
ncbi:hypothetical protein C8J57DRAFT_1705015 [Mycena rebaudengoi]|nr:hypothetical protein C8J57DRAFT_1705015 [Mycena rebaudengoi]